MKKLPFLGYSDRIDWRRVGSCVVADYLGVPVDFFSSYEFAMALRDKRYNEAARILIHSYADYLSAGGISYGAKAAIAHMAKGNVVSLALLLAVYAGHFVTVNLGT